MLPGWLAGITRLQAVRDLELVYWSYSAQDHGCWPELRRARQAFGEHVHGSTEPDLIAASSQAVVFIETKLTAGHNTHPRLQNSLQLDSQPSTRVLEKYYLAEDGWYDQVFNVDPLTLAVQQKYELMRQWLLGSWLAAQSGCDFYLIVVDRAGNDSDLERRIGLSLQQAPGRRFLHTTWEELYTWLAGCIPVDYDWERLLSYLRNKTTGYQDGVLQLAFQI
jgi:Holliday junction resolvase-like predicted endonuclease